MESRLRFCMHWYTCPYVHMEIKSWCAVSSSLCLCLCAHRSTLVCINAGVHISLWTQTTADVQRLEDNFERHSSPLPCLRQACLATAYDRRFSCLHFWSPHRTTWITDELLLCGFWGFECRCSHLCGKHFCSLSHLPSSSVLFFETKSG